MNDQVTALKNCIDWWNKIILMLEAKGICVTVSFLDARGEERSATNPKIAYRKAVKEVEL